MLSFWGILVSGLVIFAGSGLALGAALGLTGLLILQLLAKGSTYVALDAIWNVLNSFTLSAIPLFIILGEIMLRSGVSKKIYEALTPVFQSIPGGLLHTNIASLADLHILDVRDRRAAQQVVEAGIDVL